jgi:hypothetical protein
VLQIDIVRCPRCSADLEMAEYQWNKKVDCPYCGTPLRPSSPGEVPEIWMKNSLTSAEAVTRASRFLRGKISPSDFVTHELYYLPFFQLQGVLARLLFLDGKKKLDLSPLSLLLPAARPASFLCPDHLRISSGTSLYGFGELKPYSLTPPEEGRIILPTRPLPHTGDILMGLSRDTSETLFRSGLDFHTTLLFYPLHVAEYTFQGKRFLFIIDGVTGEILYGTLPARFHAPFFLTAGTALFTGTAAGFTALLLRAAFHNVTFHKTSFLIFLLIVTPVVLGKGFVALLRFLTRYLHETHTIFTDGKEFYDHEI